MRTSHLSATFILILIGLLLPFGLTAEAQQLRRIENPSSVNPVGSGAGAMGMGGAFIAVAEDATAASWNPAGLIQLDFPEVSIVGRYFSRTEDYSISQFPEASGSESSDDFELNYLSIVSPNFKLFGFPANASFNYQHLYDFNRKWKYRLNMERIDPNFYRGLSYADYEQEGDLYATGIALSMQFGKKWSVGLTLNYWGDFINKNEWEQNYYQTYNTVAGSLTSIRKDEFSFSGWNANLGFHYRFSENWRLGGVVKTPFFTKADIDHKITERDATGTYVNDYNAELTMPFSYGVGIAHFLPNRHIIAFDIYQTLWDMYEMDYDDSDLTLSPISGKEAGDSDVDLTTWLRLGFEKMRSDEIKELDYLYRAGVFYDPAPAEGSPDDYYGFSLGGGIVYEGFIFDVAYQFRYGSNVGGSTIQDFDFSQDVTEHTVYFSLVKQFGGYSQADNQ